MRKVKINDNEYIIEKRDGRTFINGESIDFDIQQIDNDHFHILIDSKSVNVRVIHFNPNNNLVRLLIDDQEIETQITDVVDRVSEWIKLNNHSGKKNNEIASPMPGLIQKILVAEGDKITQGKPLVILNAMKMENIIKAPQTGVVGKIFVKEEEQVEKGKVLIQF